MVKIMTLLKYKLILIALTLLIYKVCLAQSWKDEFDTGINLSNNGDSHKALQHFYKAKNEYKYINRNDTLNNSYATLLSAIGEVYLQKEIYDSSLFFFESAFEIRQTISREDNVDYEEVLSRIGIVNYRMGNYIHALEFFEKDVVLAEKIFGIQSKKYVIGVSNLANAYNKLLRYDKAEEFYIKSLNLKEKYFGTKSSEYLLTLTWLANLYMTTGEYRKAEPLSIDAIAIRKNLSGTQSSYYINNVVRLADLYKRIGDYSKAEPLYYEALNLSEKLLGENHHDYISLFYDIGYIHLQNGHYNQAEIYLLRSANKIEKLFGKDNVDFAQTLNALGALYLEIADYNKAEKYLEDALAIRNKYADQKPEKYFESLNNMAELYRRTGYESLSIKMYELAISYSQKNGDTASIIYATRINNLALAYTMMQNYKTADSLFGKALAIIKNKVGENGIEYVKTMRNIGVFYLYSNIDKAEPYLLFTLSFKSKLDNTGLIGLYSSLALLYKYQRKAIMAISYEIESLQIQNKTLYDYSYFMSANQLAQYYTENKNQFAGFNNYLYEYSTQFPDLCKQSYDNELRIKGLVLRNYQQVQNVVIKSGDTNLINNLENLRSIKTRLSQYYSLSIDNLPAEVTELEAYAEGIEKKLVQGSEAYRNLKEQVGLIWKDVQKNLDSNEAAIEFINFDYYNKKWTDSILYGALILRLGYKEPKFVYLFEQKQLASLLKKDSTLLDSTFINQQYTYGNNSNELNSLIWKPLDSLLQGVETIYAAPSGILNTINLGAIPINSNTTFGTKYNLHILGTTGDIVNYTPLKINKSSISNAYLFGGVDYDKTNAANTLIAGTTVSNDIKFEQVTTASDRGYIHSWGYLPGTLTEASGIQTICNRAGIKTILLNGKNASENNFKSLSGATQPYILHLATHGYFFPDTKKEKPKEMALLVENRATVYKVSENPLLRSGLILSGANKAWSDNNFKSDSTEDGILTAYEVSNTDLNKAQLVVMSACETGLGDINGSEGVFGLQRGFKLAGAKNIIMSLWKVPDMQTSELLTLFYSNCLQGKSVPAALQSAQQEMQKKYPPYYWAAFKLLE